MKAVLIAAFSFILMSLDRTIAPSFKTIESYHLPEVSASRLTNGIPYFFYEGGMQDICRVEFVFHSGAVFEDAKGLATLTAKLLPDGTSTKSSHEIHEELALYGAFIEMQPGVDYSTLVVYVLSKYLENILPIIKEIITDPAFPELEVENQKNTIIQALKINKEKTAFLAGQKFKEVLFGANHPYGKSMEEEDWKALQAQQLKNFFKKYFTFDRCQIFFCGNGLANHQEIINRFFGLEQWNGQSINIRTPEYASDLIAIQDRINIEKTGSVQSSLRIGRKIMDVNHPDFFVFSFLCEIYGGYFGSRLMQNIREDKGYTYGIRSHIYQQKYQNYLLVYADVKQEFTDDSVNEVFKEMTTLCEKQIEEDELENVRNYLLGQFISSMNSPFAIMDRFKFIHFMDLNYDYYQKGFRSLQHTTAEDMMAAAKKYLNPDSFLVVTAG